jgi:2'-5' RNA ligase
MKAGFALLADRTVSNAVTRLAWDIHLHWRNGIGSRSIPPHISLRQPIDIGEGLEAIETYAQRLAAVLPPLPIQLGSLLAWDEGLVIDVVETPTLRQVHDRLIRDLGAIYGTVQADHDGPEYHFHLTVAIGGADAATYRAIQAACADRALPLGYTAAEVGLFVGYERAPGAWQFMLHTVLPLTGA